MMLTIKRRTTPTPTWLSRRVDTSGAERSVVSLILLLVVGANALAVEPIGAVHNNSRIRAGGFSREMELTTTVVSQELTSKVENGRSLPVLILKLRMSVRNLSDRTVILHRYGGDIYHVMVTKGDHYASREELEYESWMCSVPLEGMYLNERTFPDPSPTDEFVTIAPNGVFDFVVDQTVKLELINSDNGKRRLNAGSYFLRVRASTWQWTEASAVDLQSRWAKYGNFWFHDLTSVPMAFVIEPELEDQTVDKTSPIGSRAIPPAGSTGLKFEK
jgi:hypothetical protein